ncbi:MAG: excinuclease ABC subunit UvrA [Gemmatimonadetes bacterium]|nr:excinuclease ABC subunit UvrA [Gemmatimonadota bacterium]
MKDRILIRGARQHNLKNLDLDLPRRALIVFTGPSGSGKSSLAFDTIYAEGQRRYVESLSTYAKQFLERMEKPDVDRVEGISPAVAIEQRNPTKSSRSTVGTATEVYDYLRLLWARVGRTYCPGEPENACGREVRPDSVQSATDAVLALPERVRVLVCFPLPLSARVRHELVVENLRALGFLRVLSDGRELHLDELEEGTDVTRAGDLLVVVDRLRVDTEDRGRLADSLQTAFTEGEGEAVVVPVEGTPLRFSERFRCPTHPLTEFPVPRPQLFSFNNPYGSCPECTGFGAVLRYDETLVVPNSARTLAEGAVDPWSKPRYEARRRKLAEFARREGVSSGAAWSELPEPFRNAVLHGGRGFQGVLPFLESLEEKRYKQYIRVFLRQYQSARSCPVCGGGKLRPEALRVRVAGAHIADAAALPLVRLREWVEEIRNRGTTRLSSAGPGGPHPGARRRGEGVERQNGALTHSDLEIADSILDELQARLGFLDDVGLGYLTLDRQTRSLSGGEAQRITLANALGSKLMDTLYVLDEPTIGLHPADNDRLLRLLLRLREAGNTVIVVEHDPAAIRLADHLVELGPASGEHGGAVVFQGSPAEILEADTLTGRYLSGRSEIPVPERRRLNGGPRLRLEGAREHNLHAVDVEIPLGTLTVVTGVSGSGKSTLVHDVLFRAIERELSGGETSAKRHLGETVGSFERLSGVERLGGLVLVDQSPIGRTPRSNPVTYIKAYDEVRRVFSSLPESKKRGYGPGHFSFNVAGGRCEACKGDGQMQVEMVFMADVFVPCEICGGARFKPEILEVAYRGKNIRDVLELTADEAIRFFLHEDRLGASLWHLQQVGLGYLRLGQPAPTLSGGEAQRIKIARELALGAHRGKAAKSRKGGHGRGTLYILDEPTTGLHLDDIAKLLRVIGDLIDAGNTVLLIEHNLDVIKTADWVIDLGPGAGPEGGNVVAMGTPEEVAAVPASVTGQYLAPLLKGAPAHAL